MQKSGFGPGRTVDVIQTRPWSSNIGLWTLLWLFHGGSLPKFIDGAAISCEVIGVAGSRTVNGTRLIVLCAGSSTGR